MKTRFSLKALGAAALLGLSTIAMTAPANAQLSEVLDAVRRDNSALSAENQQRLNQFENARDEQAALLADARRELANAEARGSALSAEFDANEATLDELQAQLDEQAGDFSELLGQFRTAAAENNPKNR